MAEGLENKNKHKIAQALLLFAAIALFILAYFSVFGSGLFLDIVLGFTSIFLVVLFSSIFVEKKGLHEELKHLEECGLTVPIVLGLVIVGFAAFGYVTSGVVLSFGIQLFLMGLFNLLRFLNENVGSQEKEFLKLFYKTENTTLAISILTCLSLSVMVLCGYCDLAFAISFGTPLLGVSLILKLGMFLYDRYNKSKIKEQNLGASRSGINEDERINSNLNLNNNKDDLGNNQFPPQDDDNEKNKETNLNDPSGSGSK